MSASTVGYGAEQGEHLHAQVVSTGVTTPTGAVTFSSSGSTLCVAALASGVADCTLTSTQLAPAVYPIVATYGGDAVTNGQASISGTLSVTKASSTTALSLSTTSVKAKKLSSVTVKVSVKTAAGGSATGTVVVTAGKKMLCTLALAQGAGTCHLKAKALGVGKYTLAASYQGSVYHATSKSAGKNFVVKK
jgi:hypothetical protein